MTPFSVGCCVGSLEQLDVLEAAGADFCELPLAKLIMAEQGVFEEVLSRLRDSPVSAQACNIFLPPDLHVVGPAVDESRRRVYVKAACERMSALGIKIAVLGSGHARNVPEGFDREQALDQFAAFVRETSQSAVAAGITLAIEHLRHAETNLINSIAEAAEFVRERQLDDVRLLVDIYHMEETGEDLDVLDSCAGMVAHVHLADSGRCPPGQGDWDLAGLIQRLRDRGYEGRLSIECRWSDFPHEAPRALRHVRQIAGDAA